MKIGNAFSLNMVHLPAKISAQKISAEQIKDMVSGSTVKQIAYKLAYDGLEYEETEGIEYVYFAGKHGHLEWDNNATRQEKIESLSIIGLKKSEKYLDAIYAIADNSYHIVELESVIDHADTAHIVSDMLGVELPANRATVKLQPGEKMIVAQYSGPRLPEGATSLPEGAKIEFVLMEVN